MTVTTTAASQTFQGNGIATAFPCTFEIFLDTDIDVYFVNPTTGAQTPAVLNSDYTVAGAGASNGFTVNTTVPAPTGTNLYVVRALPLTQPTDFTNQGAFFPNMHEQALDRLCMLIQQIANYSEGLNITMPPGLVPQPSTLFPIPQGGALIGWDPTGSFLQNTGPSGLGAGNVLNVNIAANAAIASTKINFNQPSTGQFFSQNGALFNRFNDRLFLGAATLNEGAYPSACADWFSAWQRVELGGAPYSLGARLVVEAGTSAGDADACAAIFAVQSLNFANVGTSCIGTESYAVNNNTTTQSVAWAYYGEGHRLNNTVGGAYAMELDVRQMGASVVSDPYGQNFGSVIALQLAAGAGVSATGQFNCSAAINIAANPMPFNSGIIFESGSVVGPAIAMAANQSIAWFSGAGQRTASIVSSLTSAANATGINFTSSGLQIFAAAAGAPTIAYFQPTASSVNYFTVTPGATGTGVQIGAWGADTNIDLKLLVKGAGAVWLGTYAASAPSATGYITVKDSTGTVRKLLCA